MQMSGDDLEMPDLIEADNDLCDDNDDDDIPEEMVEFTDVPCLDLFSDKAFSSARECISYCKNVHGFDLEVLSKRLSLDCFSFICLVNFIGAEKPSAAFLMSLSSIDLWKDEKFLKPVIPDDPLLMFDIESFVEDEELAAAAMSSSLDDSNSFIPSDEGAVSTLMKTVDKLKSELSLKNAEMEQLYAKLESMKHVTQSLVESVHIQSETKSVAEVRDSEDDAYYAGSYSHFGIHHEMLSDRCRTEAYRDAIQLNAEQISGKSVLDLGCGTGILSMFSADLGHASKVIGVDMSETIFYAMDIVRENKLDDKIVLLKGRLEDIDLKEHLKETSDGQLDVLVSEWMGYFLLFEGMLDSVLYARDRYLKPGGLILPNRCTMHLVGVCDLKRYEESIDFWQNVYGYKMSCMKEPSVKEASVEVIPASSLITDSVQIHELDMTKCNVADTEFESEVELTVKGDGYLTSLAGYFVSFFDDECLSNKVVLSTSPESTPTHWKQCSFIMKDKMKITKGQKLRVSIKVVRPNTNVRGLKVILSVEGKTQTYSIE